MKNWVQPWPGPGVIVIPEGEVLLMLGQGGARLLHGRAERAVVRPKGAPKYVYIYVPLLSASDRCLL